MHETNSVAMFSPSKIFLHVGCGKSRKAQTTGFNRADWDELRLDIDPAVAPDVVGSLTDMADVGTGSVDAIYSAHNIEHLYPHEVPLALGEFKRVLKDDGFVVLTCPDLQPVGALLTQNNLTEQLYLSASGPISALDILFGHQLPIARGNLFMAHHCGFTQKVLVHLLQTAGFGMIASLSRPQYFDLWALATVGRVTQDEMEVLARHHFPNDHPGHQ